MKNSETTPDALFNDLNSEEMMMLQACSLNILKNLDKQLKREHTDHNQVSRLLSMKWFLHNEINPVTS